MEGFAIESGAAHWGANEAELGHPGSGGGAAQRQVAAALPTTGLPPQISGGTATQVAVGYEQHTTPADHTMVIEETDPNVGVEVGPELH